MHFGLLLIVPLLLPSSTQSTNKHSCTPHFISYQKYHKDYANFHTRVLLQMGGFGKEFCLKRGSKEIGIKAEHGTVMFMKKELAGANSKYYHGVPKDLNKGKITGSSILLIDLVKVKA